MDPVMTFLTWLEATPLAMALIIVAGLNAAAFHAWPFRSVTTWNQFAPIPWPARTAAALSLLLWATIAALGRFIAYVE